MSWLYGYCRGCNRVLLHNSNRLNGTTCAQCEFTIRWLDQDVYEVAYRLGGAEAVDALVPPAWRKEP